MSESIELTQPTPRAVFQRNAENFAPIPISGTCGSDVVHLDARYEVMPGGTGQIGTWQVISDGPTDGRFEGTLNVPCGGWYRIEVRGITGQERIACVGVENVGVGEVFITAGQSNAANFGEVRTVPEDDRVSALGPEGWQFAADPQPTADGELGSPWPTLGDLLVRQLGVPVGFISVGVGGTSVIEWTPDGELYQRLQEPLVRAGKHGIRAVLWHQGESDLSRGTSTERYISELKWLIEGSREDAGWDVPWVIAGASYLDPQYLNPLDGLQERMAAIRGGQRKICDYGIAIEGPFTDDLAGPEWRFDGAHFNRAGLCEHSRRWAEVLLRQLWLDW